MENSTAKLNVTNYFDVYGRQWLQDQYDAQYFGDGSYVPEREQLLDLFRHDEKMRAELDDDAMEALVDDVIEYVNDQIDE